MPEVPGPPPKAEGEGIEVSTTRELRGGQLAVAPVEDVGFQSEQERWVEASRGHALPSESDFFPEWPAAASCTSAMTSAVKTSAINQPMATTDPATTKRAWRWPPCSGMRHRRLGSSAAQRSRDRRDPRALRAGVSSGPGGRSSARIRARTPTRSIASTLRGPRARPVRRGRRSPQRGSPSRRARGRHDPPDVARWRGRPRLRSPGSTRPPAIDRQR